MFLFPFVLVSLEALLHSVESEKMIQNFVNLESFLQTFHLIGLPVGGGDKWVKSKTVRWTPPGLFNG